jgi:hypothetical protein
MNEKCIEECAIKKDCSGFSLMKYLKVEDMQRFPKTAGMTKEERFIVVCAYLAKIVDHLKGVEDDNAYPIRRPHTHRAPGRNLPANIQIKDLLPHFPSENSTLAVGEECSSTGIRSQKLVKPTG